MRDPSEVIAALHSEWESLNLSDAYAVSVFLARVMAWLRALTPPAGAAPEQGEAVAGEAVRHAVDFINALFGSHTFTMAVSHDGEINFIFGNPANLFQVLIGDAGASFHGHVAGVEVCGNNIPAAQFPHYNELRTLVRPPSEASGARVDAGCGTRHAASSACPICDRVP